MRKINIISTIVALSALLGSSAFAADRTTASATLVNPNTQTYVGTFIQNCVAKATSPGISIAPLGKGQYVGVYLAQPYQIQANAALSISTMNGIAFSTTPRAFGEEGVLSEIGGLSRMSCMPIGTRINLLASPNGAGGPIILLGTGTVKSI